MLWQVVLPSWISSSGFGYSMVVHCVVKFAKLQMAGRDAALVAMADSWCDRCENGHYDRSPATVLVMVALLLLLQLLREVLKAAALRG